MCVSWLEKSLIKKDDNTRSDAPFDFGCAGKSSWILDFVRKCRFRDEEGNPRDVLAIVAKALTDSRFVRSVVVASWTRLIKVG